LPEDIDRHLQTATAPDATAALETGAPAPAVPTATPGYREIPLPRAQRTLVYRLQQATREIIPATMEIRVGWSGIENARERLRENAAGPQPSQFLIFAWCVAQAAKSHARFRSALQGDSTLREYERLNLGIAVARADDELLLARVDGADSLGFAEF